MADRLQEASWGGLNERQQAFIDAIAYLELECGESPDEENGYNTVSYTVEDIADTMQEEFGTKPYASEGSTVFYLKKRRDLIEERKAMMTNERNGFEGTESTDPDDEEEVKEIVRTNKAGNTYEGPAEGIDGTMQHIADRPVKNVETEDDEIHVTISFTRDDLLDFLREADEETAREVLDEVMG